MHILPQLRELERRYHDVLVVIGIHSPKFPAERATRNLADAVRRLEIQHPVVNDRSFSIWSSYAVRAWPTLMFIDPAGKVVAKHEGEFTLEMLEPFLSAALDEYRAAGTLQPSKFELSAPLSIPDGPLAYPSAVHADEATDRLYIADANHNSIVVSTLAGEVRQVYGVIEAGFGDGPPGAAQFDHPQGLALSGETLFVADTGNHAIRAIDLRSGATTTIAGTGEQAYRYVSGGPARETPLNSPWGLAVVDDTLYIAMAGNHQIWTFRSAGDEVRRFAGSGHEGLRDGATPGAHLAQPSGITRLGNEALAITDSETSSLRVVDVPGFGAGVIRTLIGEGLFEFGAADGDKTSARMQHPLGVAYDPTSDSLYVADTYNNAIRRYHRPTGLLGTWLGPERGLYEPSGVSIAAGRLFIADTNNQRICRADLATGELEVLELRGL